MLSLAQNRFGALKAWIPHWVILPGFRLGWSKKFFVEQLPLQVNALAGLSKGSAVDVCLSDKLLLVKTVELPKASKATTQKAIDLQIKQSMPNNASGLIWQYQKTGTIDEKQVFKVALLKKRQLVQVEHTLAQAGYKCRTVSASDKENDFPPFQDNRSAVDRPTRVWGLLTLALLIGAVSFYALKVNSDIGRLQTELAQLEATKRTLTAEVIELRETAQQEEQKTSEMQNDLSLLQSEATRLPILLDLTTKLSDDTWISEFALSSSTLSISGFTSVELTKVISTIRDFDWVTKVDLIGPVSFDSYTRRNRFSLNIELTRESL